MWNNAGTLKVKGDINFALLEDALNIFLQENDSIRLRIGVDKGVPYQYVAPYEPYHGETLDFSELGLEKLYEWDVRQTRAPMPLVDSRLYYFVFLSVSPSECWIYAKFHIRRDFDRGVFQPGDGQLPEAAGRREAGTR